MKGGEIFFALSAEKSDRAKNLGAIFFRGKTAIRILDILSRYDYVLSYLNKLFIIPARGTRDQLDGWTIFKLHGLLMLCDG